MHWAQQGTGVTLSSAMSQSLHDEMIMPTTFIIILIDTATVALLSCLQCLARPEVGGKELGVQPSQPPIIQTLHVSDPFTRVLSKVY